mmetsp:Transcript_52858/g.67783  ORF Transcript_52858/g.67783 Transcript_52858/m.67783 type:complete len:874 (-) Transcript_52858:283-2904(-)
MKFISIVLLSLASFGAAARERAERPAHIELQHLNEGVQFKIKAHPEKHNLRADTEHARVAKIADMVGKAISHLTGGVKPERVFRHAGVNEQKQIDAGLHLWYRFDVHKKTAEEPEFAGQQRAVEAANHLTTHRVLSSDLQKVEVEAKYRLLYETDDPRLAEQTASHYGIVNLADAWELTAGSSDVVVQVIDTGIDEDHPDLQTNKWVNSGETCADGSDNDGNGYTDDCNGYNHADGTGTDLEGDGSHGTHCSGTIAADNDNGEGVAGIAGGKGGNSGASLMTSVVFGSTSTSGFAEALIYGADNGAHISSNSWGYTSSGVYDSSVLDAIDYAADAGVLVVFAAGNDGTADDWYPGYYEPTIAVAALDNTKTAAYFTNYGDWVDISAPGYPVLSTVTVADGSYDWYSGTSMACPHVAGGLALAKSYLPSATADEIKACLFSSAEEIDSLNSATYAGGLGAGLMDIPALLNCLGEAPTNAPTFTPAPSTLPIIAPTPMPIVCGDCSSSLTLNVFSDRFPSESSYSLVAAESTPCFDDVSGPDSTWSSETSYSILLSDKLCENTEYTFNFADSFGDGICCGYGEGFYSLVLDGRTIFESDGDFGSSESFPIDTSPVPAPTAAPVAAPTAAINSVRTCDELGWDADAYGSDEVCGESEVNSGQCTGKVKFDAAETYCADIGARLCTKSELLDDEARGTGCNYDNKWVWSKTSCSDGYMITKGSTSSSNTPRCVSSTSKARTRCCADTVAGPPVPAPTPAPADVSESTCDELEWDADTQGSSDVCGGSVNAAGSCSGKKKFSAAESFCENQGARLCTLDELLNDEAKGTGCNFDTKRVWSSTPCDNGYYTAAGSTQKSITACKGVNNNNVRVRCCADV